MPVENFLYTIATVQVADEFPVTLIDGVLSLNDCS